MFEATLLVDLVIVLFLPLMFIFIEELKGVTIYDDCINVVLGFSKFVLKILYIFLYIGLLGL